MGVITRTTAIFSAQYDVDTPRDEALLDLAKGLYKEGIIRIKTVYDKELECDVIEYSAQIYVDEDKTPKKETRSTEPEKEEAEVKTVDGLTYFQKLKKYLKIE